MEYAFDRAISVAGTYVGTNAAKNIKEGQLAFWAEQITEPSLSFTSETEEIMDARNNVVMVLQNGRGATFGASNAFFNTSILAAQTGGAVKNSEGATITKFEMVTADENGKANVSYTPSDASSAVVYELNTDGSFKTAQAVADVVLGVPAVGESGTAGYVEEKPKALGKSVKGADDETTVTEGGLIQNTKYLVVYDIAAPAGEQITALADAENELLDITAEVLLRDLCSQEIYFAFLFMRGKLSGEAEWGMARDGAHAFEVTAMPAYCDAEKKLVDIVIVKDEELRK
jgi:hypothetical protein